MRTVWKARDRKNWIVFCIKIKNKWFAFYIFSNHSILSRSLFLVYCEVSFSSVKWNDPYTSNDFSTLKRITDKNNNIIHTNEHALQRRDRSFRVLALNVWRVSALLSPGSYVGAIEAHWLRRCCCHRRKNKKNFTTQDTCAIFNAWVLGAWMLR